MDLITSSGNILTNGDLSAGPNGGIPTGWTFQNVHGASFLGMVQIPCSFRGRWYDGSVQAYDELSQTIAATIGDTYEISFWNRDDSALTT